MNDPRRGTAADTRGTIVGAVILTATLVASAATALAVGSDDPRWPRAVAFATAITAFGGLGGWLAARTRATNPAMAVAAGLGATALRIIPPLAGLAWLTERGADLRAAGADGLLVGFYLVLLATTILLHIMGAWLPTGRRDDEPR